MLSIRRINFIGRTYRHVRRYKQILQVFLKYGFGDILEILRVEQYLELGLKLISPKQRPQLEKSTRAERIRMAIEELGPTFIKLGQILSTRPDLIPLRYVQEFSKLQDDVPSFPYQTVREIFMTEIGKFPEEIFQFFEEKPLAAASIGQVHRAQLKTGQEVVVKIQRPGIKKLIEVDLEILLHLASLMEKHLEGVETLSPTKIVEEFAKTLEKEIDYTSEAANIERFARQFIGNKKIYVPKIFHEIITERILTMEYVQGIKISSTEQLQQNGHDLKEIAKRGATLIMEQVFMHGFFHADPHPGNILIMQNNVLCCLDFGLMGRISIQEQEDFVDLIMAMVLRDVKKATKTLLKMTIHLVEPDIDGLDRDLSEFIDRHLYLPLKDLKIRKIFQQLMEISSKYSLRLKPDQFLQMKALSSAEGIGRMLDPEMNIVEYAKPFIGRIQANRHNPKRIAVDILESSAEFASLFKDTPRELRAILKQAKEGKVKIEFEHHGLRPMLSLHDQISNRIAFAIVLAALMIASSLMVLSGIPPTWHEIPVIGLAGFVAAAVMALWLLSSIMRHGRI